jgi:hypothetical protein
MSQRSKVVFLSYAHADEAGAVGIYQHLLKAGFEPWLDKFSLKPGQDWREEIGKAIRHCGAFLSLVSTSSVDRGGVLAGEMKFALDRRAERLDNGGIFIPVLLEKCELPAELRSIQALSWFLPDSPAELTKALESLLAPPTFMERVRDFAGSRWALVSIALVCFAGGIGIYRTVTGISFSEAYETFMLSRPGSPHPPPSTTPPQIGITVWRVSDDNATGAGTCGYLRFSRQPLAQPVHTGDRLRIDIQASRTGYIYILSRELDESGKPGPARLLFPVITPGGANNQITPGNALLIPPASDVCNTLQLTHAGDREQVSVFLSEKPLEDLPAQAEPYSIDPALDAKLTASAVASTSVTGKSSEMTRDVQLGDSGSRDLNYTSVGPDAVFTANGSSMGPVIATFTLKTVK